MSVYNGRRFLREAIESILSQTFCDFEFIIVDDGSTDGTAAILDSYTQSDPRVRVYHQDNRGQCASDNRGCGLARGKYIARMHADDVSTPDRFERQIRFLEDHEEVGLLGGAIEEINEQGMRISQWQPPQEDQRIRAGLRSFLCPLCHPAVVMRKQAFDATGGYRAQFLHGEDYDLWLRIIEGWRVANLPDMVLRKRIHAKQISTAYLRQMVFSCLGAHALSSARQHDSVEPPCQVPVISEGFLEKLGVSQVARQKALIKGYVFCIGSMLQASQEVAALHLVDELIGLSKSGPVSKTTLANARLSAAQAYYRRGDPVRALGALGQALLTRPVVAGRPLRRAVNSLFRKSPAGDRPSAIAIPKDSHGNVRAGFEAGSLTGLHLP